MNHRTSTKTNNYGILQTSGDLLKGMTREEAYAYMESEGNPGDRIVVRSTGGEWWTIDGTRVK